MFFKIVKFFIWTICFLFCLRYSYDVIAEEPTINIVRNEEDNTVYVTWDDENYIVTINGEDYVKGTIISVEGEYIVEVSDSSSIILTETFKITHDFRYYKDIPPTCTHRGYTIYVCISCEDLYTGNYVTKLDHTYIETVIEPTCTTDGYTLQECETCTLANKIDVVAAYGHNFYKTSKNVTCTENGGTYNICQNCNLEEAIEIIPAIGHEYYSQLIQESTCSTKGTREFNCQKCGDCYTIEIPLKEHVFLLTDETNSEEFIELKYICTYCNYTYNEIIKKGYNTIINFINYIMEEYQKYLISSLIITSSMWSVFIGIKLILVKDKNDKIKIKKMIINYLIGLVTIFIILVICPLLIEGICYLIR